MALSDGCGLKAAVFDPSDHEVQSRLHTGIHPAQAGRRPSILKAWGDVGLKARLNPRYQGTPPHPER